MILQLHEGIPWRQAETCLVALQRHDPCLLDTFIAAIRYMAGEPKKPWWKYTAERKSIGLAAGDKIGGSLTAFEWSGMLSSPSQATEK